MFQAIRNIAQKEKRHDRPPLSTEAVKSAMMPFPLIRVSADNIDIGVRIAAETVPVPEPHTHTHAVMLAGLGPVSWTARRRLRA